VIRYNTVGYYYLVSHVCNHTDGRTDGRVLVILLAGVCKILASSFE
jgi:hypothetical protein